LLTASSVPPTTIAHSVEALRPHMVASLRQMHMPAVQVTAVLVVSGISGQCQAPTQQLERSTARLVTTASRPSLASSFVRSASISQTWGNLLVFVAQQAHSVRLKASLLQSCAQQGSTAQVARCRQPLKLCLALQAHTALSQVEPARQIASLAQRANTAKVQVSLQQQEHVRLDIIALLVLPRTLLLARLRSEISQLVNALQDMPVQQGLPFLVPLASTQTWHRRPAQLARLVSTALDTL
jgi:hypothetical protein